METQIEKQFSPYFASINYDPAQDTEQDRLEFSKKFFALSKIVKYGFLDDEIEGDIRRICEKYNINDVQKVGEVSRMVRGFFIDRENEKNWKDSAKNKLQLKDEEISGYINEIKGVVAKVEEIGNKTLRESVEKMPIIPALKKYERLGDQDITDNQIEIEIGGTRELVNPNIKNWLEDYIQNKGAQTHNNIERSDYLYKSKNTEELSTIERNKLSLLLVSYDKDDLLAVDKNEQEIIFDNTLDTLDVNESEAPTDDHGGVGDNVSSSIELSSISSEGETKKSDQESLKKEKTSQKSHEINWYGTDPFDGLEKIDNVKDKQGSQNVKMDMKKDNQATKHVVDLKNS